MIDHGHEHHDHDTVTLHHDGQVYNLFHPSNPVVARLEPLLVPASQQIPPVNIPRYQMFPLGDGARVTLADMIQTNPSIFSNSRLTPVRSRRMSNDSIQSGLFDTQQAHTIAEIKKKWWGTKRLGKCFDGYHISWEN